MALPHWPGPRRRALFNRQVTNKVVRPLAGRLPLLSLVEHTGRRSGAHYRTPVTMMRTGDGVAVLLPYGRDADWVRNLLAAGGGRIVLMGTTLGATDPRVVSATEAAGRTALPWKLLMARLGVAEALLLTVAG